MSGGLIDPALYDQLHEMWRWYKTNVIGSGDEATPEAAKPPTRYPRRAVILDAALTAGSLLSPTSAQARLCEWDGSGYEQTDKQITVYNHSQESHETDTGGAAIWIDGHWWFFGDCEPEEDRPDPPELPE